MICYISATKSCCMQKVFLTGFIFFIALTGCKKASKTDSDSVSPTNFEITATSTEVFTIRIQQISPTYKVIFTEVGASSSNYEKKLLLKAGDQAGVSVHDAKAPVHLVVTYKGQKMKDVTGIDDINYQMTVSD